MPHNLDPNREYLFNGDVVENIEKNLNNQIDIINKIYLGDSHSILDELDDNYFYCYRISDYIFGNKNNYVDMHRFVGSKIYNPQFISTFSTINNVGFDWLLNIGAAVMIIMVDRRNKKYVYLNPCDQCFFNTENEILFQSRSYIYIHDFRKQIIDLGSNMVYIPVYICELRYE